MVPLSPKEAEVLRLYDQGKSYKTIASALGCSLNTLKTHTRKIILKSLADSLRHAAYLRRSE